MEINWFTPNPEDKTIVNGVILQAVGETSDDTTYVPYPLPTGTVAHYENISPEELVALMPDDVPVFDLFEDAAMFILNLWTMLRHGMDAHRVTPVLVDMNDGYWSTKEQFLLSEVSDDDIPF